MAKNERFEDGKAWQQARVLTNSLYAVTETGTFCNRQQKVEHRLISRKGAKAPRKLSKNRSLRAKCLVVLLTTTPFMIKPPKPKSSLMPSSPTSAAAQIDHPTTRPFDNPTT